MKNPSKIRSENYSTKKQKKSYLKKDHVTILEKRITTIKADNETILNHHIDYLQYLNKPNQNNRSIPPKHQRQINQVLYTQKKKLSYKKS